MDFISEQDDIITLVKKQASLITVRSSPLGHQVFDLPENLKRNNSPTRPRKDLYTSLLLLAEGVKAYNDLMRQAPAPKGASQFIPKMIGKCTRY